MKADRPGEFICFCPITLPTKEGDAHTFFSIDAFSGFLMNTGSELTDDAETILKHIYLLTEHPEFKKKSEKGYTLVLHDYHDLAARIKSIIEPYGKILFDKDYHEEVSTPVIESLFSRFK